MAESAFSIRDFRARAARTNACFARSARHRRNHSWPHRAPSSKASTTFRQGASWRSMRQRTLQPLRRNPGGNDEAPTGAMGAAGPVDVRHPAHEVGDRLDHCGFRRRHRQSAPCRFKSPGLVCRRQQTIVSDPLETVWQQMQEEAVNKTISYFSSFRKENKDKTPHFL